MSGFAWNDIDVHFEIAFGYTLQDTTPVWTGISEYVEDFDTKRGRNTLLGRWEPGHSTWWLDNSSGRFDPNNASSPYAPNVKIGVPARIRVTHHRMGLIVDGSGHAISDAAASLAITGDVRLEGVCFPDDWTPAAPTTLIHLRDDTGAAAFNSLMINTNGTLLYVFTEDGITVPHTSSTVAVPFVAGEPGAIRADHDVDDGSGGSVVTFYTAPAGTNDWVQLGVPVAVSPSDTYSIFAGTSEVVGRVGTRVDGFGFEGKIFSAKVYDGATQVANPDFSDSQGWVVGDDAGDANDDDESIGWTLAGTAEIDTAGGSIDYVIFRGSVPEWPLEYDTASEYAFVQVPIVESRALSLGGNISGSFPLQRTDERIDAILDEVGWPAALRDLDVGVALVAAAELASVKASDHIDEVVLAEVGHFFIAVDGKATFRSRTANAGGATSQATFGVGNIEYDAIVPRYNDEEVYNDVRITRTGGVEQVADDASAQTDLGYVITFDAESAVFYTDHGALNTADWMLGRHKDVKVRIRALEWSPQFEGSAGWPAALGLDLRQTVTVQFSPPGGGTALNQLAAIQGIRHRARGGGKWLTTFDLAPLAAIETDNYWILGTSALDTEAKLA